MKLLKRTYEKQEHKDIRGQSREKKFQHMLGRRFELAQTASFLEGLVKNCSQKEGWCKLEEMNDFLETQGRVPEKQKYLFERSLDNFKKNYYKFESDLLFFADLFNKQNGADLSLETFKENKAEKLSDFGKFLFGFRTNGEQPKGKMDFFVHEGFLKFFFHNGDDFNQFYLDETECLVAGFFEQYGRFNNRHTWVPIIAQRSLDCQQREELVFEHEFQHFINGVITPKFANTKGKNPVCRIKDEVLAFLRGSLDIDGVLGGYSYLWDALSPEKQKKLKNSLCKFQNKLQEIQKKYIKADLNERIKLSYVLMDVRLERFNAWIDKISNYYERKESENNIKNFSGVTKENWSDLSFSKFVALIESEIFVNHKVVNFKTVSEEQIVKKLGDFIEQMGQRFEMFFLKKMLLSLQKSGFSIENLNNLIDKTNKQIKKYNLIEKQNKKNDDLLRKVNGDFDKLSFPQFKEIIEGDISLRKSGTIKSLFDYSEIKDTLDLFITNSHSINELQDIADLVQSMGEDFLLNEEIKHFNERILKQKETVKQKQLDFVLQILNDLPDLYNMEQLLKYLQKGWLRFEDLGKTKKELNNWVFQCFANTDLSEDEIKKYYSKIKKEYLHSGRVAEDMMEFFLGYK